MARDSLPTAEEEDAAERTGRTRCAGWWLAGSLALLGLLLGMQRLGWHRLTRAAGVVVDALAKAAWLLLGAGWLLLLLVAAGLVLRLSLSSQRGRAVVRWLQVRLTTRPVRWTAAALGALVLLVLVVIVLPPRFTAHRTFSFAHEELKAQNDVRTTLLQALAGGVLLLGGYFTWQQLRATREGQLTDRYTKAVDQLGAAKALPVRLGGLYALERIARDSSIDQRMIAIMLCAYARTAEREEPPSPERGLAERAADVQAALTILARWREDLNVEPKWLDLHGAEFQGARLQDAQLQGAQLFGAELQDAHLDRAKLQGANLWRACLQRAHLEDAQLEGAILIEAQLQGATATLSTRWPKGFDAEKEGVKFVDEKR
jgi:hypothetical protein